ncbi:2-polyprenyl-6-methoxyphenol hydroxylase-like FAD-dependent oxidoreductase [Streptomyces olivoverticillatus]|uniref:2-polyprenyl-6-methoxyphenol hydroxylase-like FAD-dependent oxidoreductase n=1 Tax=Streptomyces olivoverticillatus TaxID=66427 RepID=A0A7W7LMY4_9ACTN|nr:FAD-dependent monooxygenase [Streptomyces olivoverticillatus]MBB4893190.1 2-polyprenyl-6-methoxyphenol hydroxylase-like FAD-dependent oxidoreductase [Streptomyces olivoverticillatus]
MGAGRVAIVGGSIAGCAAALAMTRAGAGEVVVFERATGRLHGRGIGLAVHKDRYAELEAAGYTDADMPWVRLTRRTWITREGGGHAGRVLGAVPFPFRSYAWGPLWNALRARMPESVAYVQGAAVERVVPGPDAAVLCFADGREERFDLVIGADGYRSVVRAATRTPAAPGYAGYLAWRGAVPGELLPGPRTAWPEGEATTVTFPGGHMIAYRIPGPRGAGISANWVFYTAPPPSAAAALKDPTSLPPGMVTEELTAHHAEIVERHFPPYWQDFVRATPRADTAVQPLYDLAVPHYGQGRLVLVGDAASVARPHMGGGAVKALQDVVVLERSLRSAGSWQEGVRAYDAERSPSGRAVVDLARRLGHAQVEATPDWPAMDERTVETWWREVSDGERGFGGHALDRAAR